MVIIRTADGQLLLMESRERRIYGRVQTNGNEKLFRAEFTVSKKTIAIICYNETKLQLFAFKQH